MSIKTALKDYYKELWEMFLGIVSSIVLFLFSLIFGWIITISYELDRRKIIKHDRFCPPACEYLYPTEMQQQKKENYSHQHWCSKYAERVYHRSNHPKILKCRECKQRGI